MNEIIQPFEIQKEALTERLHLRDQWEAQIKALNEAGVLEILPESQDIGIIGIDGKEYPIPTYEDIKKMITPENAEMLEKKLEQGFTKLLLVPFAMPLDLLIERYKRLLVEKHKQGKLLSTEGTPLPLNPEDPLYKWENYNQADVNGKLVYYPERFDPENHGGKAKQQLMREGNNWEIQLIEDLPDLPGQGKGQTIGGRKQLEANESSKGYLQITKTNPAYQNEQGFTPESWLAYAIAELQGRDRQIDDRQGEGKACFNFGSYFPADSNVSYCNFNRVYSRASLDRSNPDNRDENNSARSSVKINS